MKKRILFMSCLMLLTACVAKATSTVIAGLPTSVPQTQVSEACSLVSSPEVDKAVGFTVAYEQISFDTSLLTLDGEKPPFGDDDICRIYSVSDDRNFLMLVISHHTSININNPVATFTPLEWYESQHQALREEYGTQNPQFYDLDQISDRAYFVETTVFREIHFFKSGVEYILVVPAEQGVSTDALIKVAKIIESQIP